MESGLNDTDMVLQPQLHDVESRTFLAEAGRFVRFRGGRRRRIKGVLEFAHVPPLTADHRSFILEHTLLAPVAMVPEISIYTASDVAPLWGVTSSWVDAKSAGVPFWSVPWAGGQALARWILDRPDQFRGRRVLDFACGSGLVGIAAAKVGAIVLAVDIDPLAISATQLNAETNRVLLDTKCEDIVGSRPDVDIVVAGDIFYERAAAERFAAWFRSLDIRVIAADPARNHVPEATEIARYEVPTSIDLESVTMRVARVLEF